MCNTFGKNSCSWLYQLQIIYLQYIHESHNVLNDELMCIREFTMLGVYILNITGFHAFLTKENVYRSNIRVVGTSLTLWLSWDNVWSNNKPSQSIGTPFQSKVLADTKRWRNIKRLNIGLYILNGLNGRHRFSMYSTKTTRDASNWTRRPSTWPNRGCPRSTFWAVYSTTTQRGGPSMRTTYACSKNALHQQQFKPVTALNIQRSWWPVYLTNCCCIVRPRVGTRRMVNIGKILY